MKLTEKGEMIELVDKLIKTVIVTVFHTFKKLDERAQVN